MIRHLAGTIIDITTQTVVVDVHGVGYQIHVTHSERYQLEHPATFWTHHAVRETASDLFGFTTRDELAWFELLLTLPKVGPKSALQIMTHADCTLLQQAVAEQDANRLAKLSGIGKKTAEKIVVELKDKIDAVSPSDHDTTSGHTGSASTTTLQTELVEALLALGYPEQNAREMARTIPEDCTDINSAIRHALQHHAR